MPYQRLALTFATTFAATCMLAVCSTTGGADASGGDSPRSHGVQNTEDSKHTAETSEATDQSHRPSASGTDGEHGEPAGHQKKRFENPDELAEEWNAPARDEWQRPESVVDAMEIDPGMTVADIGAGTGYFVPYLAEAVGPDGRVLAVDIERPMLDYIDEMADERGLENVQTVLAEKTDSHLERNAADRILIVDTWHHIPDRVAYAEHLRERLEEKGSVWIVDFTHDSPTGPPKKHRLDPGRVVEDLQRGGFDAEIHELELDRQYLVVGHLP